MVKNYLIAILSVCLATLTLNTFGASKIRLIYGKDWDRAGMAVKKLLESAAFKSAARGRYLVECIDESGKAPPENLGSHKIPCIFVLDEKDRCFCVIENVPYNITVEGLLKKIAFVNKKREAIEAKGTDTADQCGQLMLAMEKYVGGPKRVISKNFYNDVFEKLKKLDPKDETGWQRHFTMDDGLDLVTKATELRVKGDFAAGDALVEAEMKKPRKHLTREQQQGLLMIKFALYREDSSKNEEMLQLLTKVAAAGENTFWGTCALGWLKMKGKPPLSVYWGWNKGDFPSPKFSTTIKYGVSYSFRKAGDYTITFTPTQGSAVEIQSISLKAGDEEVAKITKKPFEYRLTRDYVNKIDSMTVTGTCAGESSGTISIARRVLRPRKSGK